MDFIFKWSVLFSIGCEYERKTKSVSPSAAVSTERSESVAVFTYPRGPTTVLGSKTESVVPSDLLARDRDAFACVSSRRRGRLLRPTRPDFSRDLAITTVRKGTAVRAETHGDDLLRCYNCIRQPRAFSLLRGNDERVTGYACTCTCVARGWTRNTPRS